MKELYLQIIVAVMCAVLGLVIGYSWARNTAVVKVSTAKSDTASCVETDALKQAALDDVVGQLERLQTDHANLRSAADQALTSRDVEIGRLLTQAAVRTNQIHEAGKNVPDCVALSRMPVCAAVGDRLWPAATAPPGAQSAGHD